MPDDDETTDVVAEAVEKLKARKAAHERAIRPPSRPHRDTNTNAVDSYAQKALDNERRAVAEALVGQREIQVNASLLALGGHVAAGKLSEDVVRREIESACHVNKFIQDDYGGSAARFWKFKGDRSLEHGKRKPHDYSNVGKLAAPEPNVVEIGTGRRLKREETQQDSRTIGLTFLSGVKSQVPTWVWKIEDVGTIQLGRLVLFAGRSGAGKSTATRWLAAHISNGTLQGAWYGVPMNVALFCGEEDTETAVINSLDAHDADRSRVAVTFAKEGDEKLGLRIIPDEIELVNRLQENEIRCLIVDPVMDTLSMGSDPNSQLDVRRVLSAYNRIAKQINGIVVGVAHLRKPSTTGSSRVRDEITGSAAWVEAVRHTITFASIPQGDGLRIMEVTKNSAGPEGDSWNYKLSMTEVETDEGIPYETIRFDMLGRSLISIDEMGNGTDDSDLFLHHVEWLRNYLEDNGPRPSSEIKKMAAREMKEHQLLKARRKLKLVVSSRADGDIPRTTWWSLPGRS